MSEQHGGTAKSIPPGEVMAAAVGALFPPVIAIFLVVQLVLSIQASHMDMTDPANQDKAVRARIAPVGEVAVRDAGARVVEKGGEEVFNAVCTSCHTSGALGAPRMNNKGDWAKRIAKGFDGLVKTATHGINQMPARGGNPDLTDGEIARAVAYMANSAGARFKVPEAKAAAAVPAAAGVPTADGKAVYDATCVACHGSGVAGAPRVGDKAAWAKRLGAGVDGLAASATRGKGAMPAKGGNASLSDAEVKAAVGFMVSQSK